MTAINSLLTAPARSTHEAASFAPFVTVENLVTVENVDAQPNYVGIYGSSILAVALFFLLGVGFPASLAYGNATGWGIGAFCAFWGGPSFGVMAGSARLSLWQDKHDHA